MCVEKHQSINVDDYPQLWDEPSTDDEEFSDIYEEIIFLTRENVNTVLHHLGEFNIDEQDWRELCKHQMGEISNFAHELLHSQQTQVDKVELLCRMIIEKQLEIHCEE